MPALPSCRLQLSLSISAAPCPCRLFWVHTENVNVFSSGWEVNVALSWRHQFPPVAAMPLVRFFKCHLWDGRTFCALPSKDSASGSEEEEKGVSMRHASNCQLLRVTCRNEDNMKPPPPPRRGESPRSNGLIMFFFQNYFLWCSYQAHREAFNLLTRCFVYILFYIFAFMFFSWIPTVGTIVSAVIVSVSEM